MRRVSALANDACLWPLGSVCVQAENGAVSLVVVLALLAFSAGVGLSADADTLAFLDQGYFRADANGTTDDFWFVLVIWYSLGFGGFL